MSFPPNPSTGGGAGGGTWGSIAGTLSDQTDLDTALGGKVPTTRTVNSKALSSDISLTASDVGAVPTSRTVNSKALSSDIALTPADVGAQPADATLTALAGVTTAAGKYPYFSGVDTAGVLDLPSGYNYIINPCFEVNQEGKSSTSDNWEYVADQWFINADGGGDIVASQQSFTVGQTDVPGEPKNYLRGVVSSASGDGCRSCIYQAIEGVRTLAGKTVTLSFYAKADAAKSISTELLQLMGSGGTPSSDVYGIGSHKFTVSTSWQKFSITATIPNLTGKTLGTNGTDALWLVFWLSAGSNHNARTDSLGLQTGTFEIANVKLEEGSVATPFVVPRFDDELRKCQRYYQIIGSNSSPGCILTGSHLIGSTDLTFTINLICIMRAAPTISINGSRGTDWFLVGNDGNANTTGEIYFFTRFNPQNAFTIYFGGGAYSGGYNVQLNAGATIRLSARL